MPKPNINVTPLIDVLLVLLIVFMIVSPLKPSRFEAKIPQPPDFEGAIQKEDLVLVVTVRSDGSLLLNNGLEYDSFATLPKFTSDIRRILEGLEGESISNARVFVKAPKSLAYGKVVQVVDAIKTAGMIPLSLQIDDLEN